MWLSTVRIASASSDADMSVGRMCELLWQQVGDQSVEHIYTRAGPGHLDISVYTLSRDQHASDTLARLLTHRALSAIDELHGWHVV